MDEPPVVFAVLALPEICVLFLAGLAGGGMPSGRAYFLLPGFGFPLAHHSPGGQAHGFPAVGGAGFLVFGLITAGALKITW